MVCNPGGIKVLDDLLPGLDIFPAVTLRNLHNCDFYPPQYKESFVARRNNLSNLYFLRDCCSPCTFKNSMGFYKIVPPKRRRGRLTHVVPRGCGGAEGRRRWPVVLPLRVYPHNRFGGALAGPERRSEEADIVRRLQVSAGRFLPETLGNRRHLPRAVVVS